MLKRHPVPPFPSIGSILTGLRRGSERAGSTAEPSGEPAIRHRVYWNEGAIRWSEDPGGDTDGAFLPVPLETGQTCRFRITAQRTNLAALAVRVGTYRRINVGSLSCRLHRPFGTVLASASTDLTTLQDNAFQAILDLHGVPLEAGRDYWVELALTADPGNEIALYAAIPEIGPLMPHRRLEGFNADDELEIESVKRGLLPRYRLDWSQDDALWSTWPTVPGPDAPPYKPYALEFREAFEFEIVAPIRRPGTLKVQLATFERRVKGHVVVELLGPAEDALLRNALDLSDVTDNSFVSALDLADTDLEPGRKYRVRLHWYGSAGNEVAVYAAPIAVGRYELRPHLESLSPDRLFTAAAWGRVAQSVEKAFLITTPGDLERPGTLLAGVRRIFPGLDFCLLSFDEASRRLGALRRSDLVVFADMFHFRADDGLSFDDLCFDLHRNLVCTVFVDQHGAISPGEGTTFTRSALAAMSHRRQHARRCHYIASGERQTVEATWPGAPARAGGALGPERLAQLVEDVRKRARPRVAVVSVLHRKADLIELFLEHVRDQNYPGEITTVLVDDASPEDDASRAMRFADRLREAGLENRRVLIHSNEGNLGNCASRLAGLAAYEADLYVIVDCDCLMNRDFVAAHVFEHWWDDVDAVIGPIAESNERDPGTLVSALEVDTASVAREGQPQDPVLGEAFVNCVTRHFSVKRRGVIAAPLFDLDFSYSAKPGSGFGWEDVEMGYRLYRKGAVIRCTDKAFVVHCSHASSIPDDRKMLGSTRNFAKLFQKHPELSLVARRWATDTYDRIGGWQEMLGVPSGPERLQLDRIFGDSRRKLGGVLPLLRGQGRRLRILTYRWHAAHQYELYKLPHAFTLATHVGSVATDLWSYDQRPLSRNARLAPFAEIDPRDYDLALLHFDENVLAAHLCNGVIPASWGDAFRRFLDISGLAKIAVCHGTVPFEGQFALDPGRKYVFQPHEDERRMLVDTLSSAGVAVVCNSHQALDDWGFENARVIWHGFDPQEFPRGTLDRDVLALQADFARPHYRGAWEFEEVLSHLAPGIRVESASHAGAPIENREQNSFAVRHFRSYVDRIRQFKFYLNTTLRSPMPRSRGEAMMTGVVPVCLRNHDVDMFIENGVDGFYADRPEDLAGFINDTIKDSTRLEVMSLAARRKALDVFNHDRYLVEWQSLLSDIV